MCPCMAAPVYDGALFLLRGRGEGLLRRYKNSTTMMAIIAMMVIVLRTICPALLRFLLRLLPLGLLRLFLAMGVIVVLKKTRQIYTISLGEPSIGRPINVGPSYIAVRDGGDGEVACRYEIYCTLSHPVTKNVVPLLCVRHEMLLPDIVS